MTEQLTSLRSLARHFKLPVGWLKSEAIAGRIPCLKVGRRMLFELGAVEAVLVRLAKEGTIVAPEQTTDGI